MAILRQSMQREGNLALCLRKSVTGGWRQETGGTRQASDRDAGTSSPGTGFSPEEHPVKSALIQSSRLEQVRSGGVSQPGSAQHWGQPLQPSVSVRGSCRSRKGTQLQLCCVVWTTHCSFPSLNFRHLIIAEKAVDSAPLTFPDGRGEGRQMPVGWGTPEQRTTISKIPCIIDLHVSNSSKVLI